METPKNFCAVMSAASAVLRFRPLTVADTAFIRRQFQDPDMCAFHGTAFEDAFADGMIASCGTVDPTSGYMRVGIVLRETGELLGTIGFHFYEADTQRAEVGYDIWKESWNMGFASEALRVLCATLPTTLPLRELYLLTPQMHGASIAVAGHNDFSPCAPIRTASDPSTAWFHRVFREEA